MPSTPHPRSRPAAARQQASGIQPPVSDIGSRRELMIDMHVLDRLEGGAELKLSEPRPAGAALRFEKPWEGAFCGYCTVLRDGDRVRLYYRGWPSAEDSADQVTCLAESDDGITFHRPNLGLYEVRGTRDNNVILTNDPGAFDFKVKKSDFPHNFAPLLDARPGVPADQRYKALARGIVDNVVDNEGHTAVNLFAFASADGVHWRMLHDQAVITKGKFDSQNLAFWSEAEGCYACYLRIAGRDVARSIARCTSEDFLHWSDPVEMDMGETPPEHLYTNQTQPYFRAPHIYVALPGRFFPGRKVLTDAEGEALGVHREPHRDIGYWQDCSDAVLMTSRGGNRYDRTFMEAFVRPGLDRRNWTSRCNYPACGVVQTGPEEMSLYVDRYNAQDSKYLERLTLRLDGFASLHAPYGGGAGLTRPLVFTGNRLTLNYSTSAAGCVRVGLLGPDGSAVPGFGIEDCDPLIGDEIDRTVTWSDRADVSALAGRPVCLRLELRDADVYSYRFGEPGGDKSLGR